MHGFAPGMLERSDGHTINVQRNNIGLIVVAVPLFSVYNELEYALSAVSQIAETG